MKILVVDPICPRGHINFNRIHINALNQIEDNIDYIFKDDFGETLGLNSNNIVLKLRDRNYKSISRILNKSILNRLKSIKHYLQIRQHLNKNKYDAIIFLSFDEILIPIIGNQKNLYLINHTNVSGVADSKLKKIIYTRYSKHATQIVFERDSYEYLDSLRIKNKIIVPHGLIEPFTIDNLNEEDDDIDGFKHVIFSPSRGSIDENLLNNLITNNEFIKYLESNEILFILRSQNITSNHKNIRVLTGHLSDELYERLFCKASLIFVPYTQSFKFRTSGVIMEGITNNKLMLIRDIPAFRSYQFFLGDSCYFNESNCISKIKNMISDTSSESKVIYINKQLLQPDYSFLLNH